MASHPAPKAGDTVRLNDHGLITCFGSPMGLAHMKSLEMKVVSASNESMTHPEATYEIEVDNPEINQFMISNWDFDIVTR